MKGNCRSVTVRDALSWSFTTDEIVVAIDHDTRMEAPHHD
jgi:hypothetical protein